MKTISTLLLIAILVTMIVVNDARVKDATVVNHARGLADSKIAKDTKPIFGLQQYYVKLEESAKYQKLIDLLTSFPQGSSQHLYQKLRLLSEAFETYKLKYPYQVIIFANSTQRSKELYQSIYESLGNEIPWWIAIKISLWNEFIYPHFKNTVLVAKDQFGIDTYNSDEGIEIRRVNIVLNYDMPKGSGMYLKSRVERLGDKGLVINFVSSKDDDRILNRVSEELNVQIGELSDDLSDIRTYIQK